MNNKDIKHLVSFTLILFLATGMVVACSQLNPSPPPSPPPTPSQPTPSQPPAISENQTPDKTPPVSNTANAEKWYTVETFNGEFNQTTSAFHIHGAEWRVTWLIEAEDPAAAVFNLSFYRKDAPYAIWETASSSGSNTGEVNYFLSSQDKRDFFINVTAKNLQHWTIIVEDTVSEATPSPIKITHIHYIGTRYPRNWDGCCCSELIEPDEYVVIKNLGDCYQDISGWVLKNISDPTIPTFKFLPNVTAYLSPGAIIRAYTDEYHPETGGLSFCYGPGDIWSNDKPDIAVLYDAQGNEVSRKSYLIPINIGETTE